MRLAAATVLALASATMAQTPEPPLYVRLSDNTCIFDGITRYRITRTAHTLDYNTSTGAYFVRTGYPLEAGGIDCPSFFDPNITTSLTTVYQAVVTSDPCETVDSVVFEVIQGESLDFECGSIGPLPDIPIGPLAILDVPGNGIDGVTVDGGFIDGGLCAAIEYELTWLTDYDYQVRARAAPIDQGGGTGGSGGTGDGSGGGCAGGSWVVVEQGTLLGSRITGKDCATCGDQIPDDDDDPDPPPPPPDDSPQPDIGGGGPNGETGPEYPGGPDNPEGIVCCQFEDGTNQEMSYAQCDDAGGVYWYPAPCDQPLGCCQIPDGDGGILLQSTTQEQCIVLEGNWYPEPCPDEEPCDDCCEAIKALLESFTDDIQAPLRDWLLEDWPDFSSRVLDVLEEDDDGEDTEPEDQEPVDPGDALDGVGDGLDMPGENPLGAYSWDFPMPGGGSDSILVSIDPRTWTGEPIFNFLKPLIVLMRAAASIGLTIMFTSLIMRTLRQW